LADISVKNYPNWKTNFSFLKNQDHFCGGSVDKEDGKMREPPHGQLSTLTKAEDTVP